MKLSSLLTTLAIGACLSGGGLYANSVTISTQFFTSPDPYGHSAGEIVANTSDNGTFVTFCLENTVPISRGTAYTYTIDPGVLSIVKPLSKGTAWLYDSFLNGTLLDYLGAGSYADANHTVDADLLQEAIWALQGQTVSPLIISSDYYYLLAQSAFGGNALDNYTGDTIKVLTPWGPDRTDVQSLLIRVPDGGTSALLLGLGLISLALFRRKQ